MNATQTPEPTAAGEDILFECPHCGKSLIIDARGAGYLITCPDCRREIQVPTLNETIIGDESIRQRVEIDEKLHALQEKVIALQKQQAAFEACFKRIGDEIVLIQAALDRLNEIISSGRAES